MVVSVLLVLVGCRGGRKVAQPRSASLAAQMGVERAGMLLRVMRQRLEARRQLQQGIQPRMLARATAPGQAQRMAGMLGNSPGPAPAAAGNSASASNTSETNPSSRARAASMLRPVEAAHEKRPFPR